ncbi:MAG: helix-turn-helix transcriptional regulator [Clostridia bacterium]|nr:helix-turn-helix transcriptional regulator [Clostridia bacterium]
MEKANKLLEICKQKGYTLRQLAKITGISIKTIEHYSIDDRFPKLKNRLIIAKVLGVDWQDIFDELKYKQKKEGADYGRI